MEVEKQILVRPEQKRNVKGQFVYTTGGGIYKRRIINGKNLQSSRYTWEQYYGKKIPKGYVIHHINGNKQDDRIENLECMSYLKHNGIHAHSPWNEGIKINRTTHPNMGHFQKHTEETKNKITKYWKDKMLPSMVEIDKLKRDGLTNVQVGEKLNLTANCVLSRWKKYKKDFCQEVKNE